MTAMLQRREIRRLEREAEDLQCRAEKAKVHDKQTWWQLRVAFLNKQAELRNLTRGK